MLSYRTIPFLIAVALVMQSQIAVASDENPWRMDVPADRQQPYYDLNGSVAGGYVESGRGAAEKIAPRIPMTGDRVNESTVAKSPPNGANMGWQSAPGKGHRGGVFGYAGPQPGARLGEQMPSVRPSNGVKFGGKIFGAFPPLGASTSKRERQPAQNIQGNVRGIQGRGSPAFANVPPPPIPDAAPAARILPYPYVGYGAVPGYRAQYGTRIAPYGGSGLPGSGGLGYRSGPTLSNPGVSPGMFGPGFMW